MFVEAFANVAGVSWNNIRIATNNANIRILFILILPFLKINNKYPYSHKGNKQLTCHLD